uniref:F-box domain-containing protein n=1 Tax=Meloidogyne hapla TaxID=6305 RepID=A0A1I8B9Y1_MELHA
MKNFPVEVQLDILKFFDYKQLYSFQLINKQLNKLINKYNNELALKGFFSFEMIPDTKVVLAERNQALDIVKDFEKQNGSGIIYNFELNDFQKIKAN